MGTMWNPSGQSGGGSWGQSASTGGITQDQYKEIMDQAKKGAGRPERPEWDSLLGDDGLMQDQYQIGDNLNRDYLEQMRTDALRAPGEQSRWRQLMEQNVQGQAGQAQAAGQAQSQAAMSNLAMRGGLRGGTAERMAQAGAQQGLQAGQGVLGKRLGLDIQDEQMRQSQLAGLGQAEMQSAQYERGTDQYNIQTALQENLQKRAEEVNAYNEQMRAWAAERTAEATPSGGGGGACFITTAVCEKLELPDDNPILNKFRKFRDVFMGGKEAVQEYYDIAPTIVANIREQGDESTFYYILSKWLIPALESIDKKDFKEAEAIYTEMMLSLKEDYL